MKEEKCKSCYKNKRCCHCKNWLFCFFDEPLSGCFECDTKEECQDKEEGGHA